MHDEFFEKAVELMRSGRPFATATVVRAERPTSGKPGDRAIVTLEGVMYGWIGGSCAQPTVIREARKAIVTDRACLIRLSPEPGSQPLPDGYQEVPMVCFSGGTLDIYIEPQQPRPCLIVIGDLPVARALIEFGKAMSYHVVAHPVGGDGEAVAAADEVIDSLPDIAQRITPYTFAVVATHGYDDEDAIRTLLSTRVPYIGLVASPKRGDAVLDTLRSEGVEPHDLSRISVPAGLDIQARRGDEIALSIMGEIVQIRRNLESVDWEDSEAADDAASRSVGQGAPAETATDPVCGMSVTIATARHVAEHAGASYYFCCPHCKAAFEGDPAGFLTAAEG